MDSRQNSASVSSTFALAQVSSTWGLGSAQLPPDICQLLHCLTFLGKHQEYQLVLIPQEPLTLDESHSGLSCLI